MPGGEWGTFSGTVGYGLARGRQLGFPTANLEVGEEEGRGLARGVFVGKVQWTGEGRGFAALVNIGVRPTFSEGVLSIELHLLDFSGDLYGKTLQVEIIEKLRDERRFERVEDLVAQIKLDIDQARAVLSKWAADNT